MHKAPRLCDTPETDMVTAVADAVEQGFEAMRVLRAVQAVETPTGLDGWRVSSTDMGGTAVLRASKVLPAAVCRGGVLDRPHVTASRRSVIVRIDCAAITLEILGNDASKLFCFTRLGSRDSQRVSQRVTRQDVQLRRAICKGLCERFPGSRWTRSSFEF